MNNRCDGWRRYGGAFTIGPPVWEQCRNTPIAMLVVEQDGKQETMNACGECWKEATESNIHIIEAKPK